MSQVLEAPGWVVHPLYAGGIITSLSRLGGWASPGAVSN